MKAKTVFKIVGWVLLGVCAAAALAFLLGLAVQALWNWLMPAVFGLPSVTYWQAVGIFILCHLLFKSHLEGHHRGGEKATHGAGRFASRVRAMLCKEGEDARPESEGGAV